MSGTIRPLTTGTSHKNGLFVTICLVDTDVRIRMHRDSIGYSSKQVIMAGELSN